MNGDEPTPDFQSAVLQRLTAIELRLEQISQPERETNRLDQFRAIVQELLAPLYEQMTRLNERMGRIEKGFQEVRDAMADLRRLVQPSQAVQNRQIANLEDRVAVLVPPRG